MDIPEKKERNPLIGYAGLCRKYAPKPILPFEDSPVTCDAEWPLVDIEGDWCGEYQPRELLNLADKVMKKCQEELNSL